MRDKMILGKNYSCSMDSSETGLNNNVAVIGCTGSGKTCSVVIPRLLNTYDMNLILTDPKAELLKQFSCFFEYRGYNVLDLNLDNPSKSTVCFDPLEYIENDADITKLAESLMNLLPHGYQSDMFWTYSAQCLAELFIRYTLEFYKHPKFSDFLEVMRETEVVEDNTSMAKLSIAPTLDRFEKKYPDHPLTKSYRILHDIAPKTLASVFISLRSPLGSVFNSDIEKMFTHLSTIDINNFINNKSILFITTDGADSGTTAYMNFIYETLIRKFMSEAKKHPEGKLPIPVHIIMDDFACGAKINSFPQLITSFRSKNISSTIVLQDESQLASMYNEYDMKTILNNNDTIIYLGGNDIVTARDISIRLNKPLEDVLYMPINRVAVFRRGQKPIVIDRYPVFDDPEYVKISRTVDNLSLNRQI